MEELDCGSDNVNTHSQVEYSTEDVTDDEDREATTEHTETQGTNDGHPERRKK
jgi:hypothetical protein